MKELLHPVITAALSLATPTVFCTGIFMFLKSSLKASNSLAIYIAFKIADHLIPLFKNIFVDSKIALDLSLGRHKCKNIITKVIAKRETQKTIKELQKRKFSILIDESTDITDEKNMCVLARYVSPTTNKITTQLLDLVYLDATDYSANKLFEAFKELFRNMKIPACTEYSWSGKR